MLLYFDERFLPRALLRARILERDIEAAVRGKGFASMGEIDAVILEPDGGLSILPKHAGKRELLERL